jgi:hypothetical protein
MAPDVEAFARDYVRKTYVEMWMPTMVDRSHNPRARKRTALWTLSFKEPKGTVKAFRLHIDAYVNKPREYIVTCDVRKLGRLFVFGYQKYLSLYRKDERRGGGERVADGSRNRGFGPVVWGHDLRDLAYEGLLFLPAKKPETKTIRGVEREIVGDVRFLIGS